MLETPNEWVEQWHILRPDADFRKVTDRARSSSPDDEGFSSSYDALRRPSDYPSSDSETRQFSSSLDDSKPSSKSMLVYPGSDEVVHSLDSRSSLKLSDDELNTLTKENTKLNRGSVDSRKV